MAVFGILVDLKKEWKHIKELDIVFDYLEKAIKDGSDINNRILSLKCDQYEKVELTKEIFAIEQSYNTKKPEDLFFESHIKYIDMQFIVKGKEIIEVEDILFLDETAPYNEKDDYVKYGVDIESSKLIIKEGNLAMLFPNDGHMPAMQTRAGKQRIFKTVVKVPYVFFNIK